MSALEVLQSCPTQRKALLLAIGGSSIITFDTDYSKPRLSHQIAFQIQVVGTLE
uniref:Uncharacterized protein n=1 Tax=Picea glauca TaxID=3330 RepID=A0A101M2Z0_PICGL|nr:hypothetical protein ABT39_MTgene3160 [Picea glauca]QHR89049.1 hypothetical protein Q903MT_gene3068 [Picea sitchensis]